MPGSIRTLLSRQRHPLPRSRNTGGKSWLRLRSASELGRTAIVSRCLALSVLLLVGCQSEVTPPLETTPAPPSASTAAQTSVDKVKFKDGEGAERYSLKFKSDGAKLVDGTDQELARLTIDDNQKVKIKDATEQVLGYVVTKPGHWKLENADQTQELYIFRRQEDGDFKLEDGTDQQIYRIKVRDYGYEIETPDKQRVYKLKASNGKLSLRDPQDQTVLSTRAEFLPEAMVCFGFEVLTPPQQAALAYAVHQSGGQ